jgi:hypothetical protein
VDGVLKTSGYFASVVSVLLLAIVSIEATVENPPMLWILIGGVATSILGMFLRWLSFLKERKAKPPPSDPPRRPI